MSEIRPMSSNFLARIADRVINRPLLIMPDKLAMISQIIEGRIGIDASGVPKVDDETKASLMPATDYDALGTFEKDASGKRKIFRQTESGVAVIPIVGSLVNRGDFFDALSGVESYQTIKQKLAAAAADPDITSIVLEIDSPGGEAVGAFEVGEAVGLASQSKPVIAHANGLCCSAAYAIAAGADRIVASKSAIVGSIGVVLLHLDYSTAIHNAGIKPTLIHAGARKADGNPYQPLTDDVAASLKSEVETFMDLFVSGVAEGRAGLTVEAIRATEARTYIGAKAVAVGLADSVGSFESVIAEISRLGGNSRRATFGAKSMADKSETVTLEAHNAAVTAAKAEGQAAGHAAGLTEGKAAGATAERERFGAIVNSEHGKTRPAQALALALTGATVEQAGAMLAVAPVEGKAEATLPADRSKDSATGLAAVDGAPGATGAKDPAKMSDHERGVEMAKLSGIV